jgi:hypothetical protein
MARATKKITIGAHQYELTQLGAVEGLTVTVKLARQLAPLLRQWDIALPKIERAEGQTLRDAILDFDASKLDPSKVDIKPFMRMLGGFLEQLDEGQLVELVYTFGKVSKVRVADTSKGRQAVRWPSLVELDGTDTVLDNHFAGDVPGLLSWLAASILHNGGRFLGAIKSTSASVESETPDEKAADTEAD